MSRPQYQNVGDFDPDLDPCPTGPDGRHSDEWVNGGRCTRCGAGSIEDVEREIAEKRKLVPKSMQSRFVPTDNFPLDRGGRKHVLGMGCWCRPEMKFNPKTFTMLVKHNDPERGVKGEH